MMIDDERQLKKWLAGHIEPLTEADPEALAKYILALLKNEESTADLRSKCVRELSDFLGDETGDFVATLFATVESRSYISGGSQSAANNQSKTQPTLQQSHSNPSATAASTRDSQRTDLRSALDGQRDQQRDSRRDDGRGGRRRDEDETRDARDSHRRGHRGGREREDHDAGKRRMEDGDESGRAKRRREDEAGDAQHYRPAPAHEGSAHAPGQQPLQAQMHRSGMAPPHQLPMIPPHVLFGREGLGGMGALGGLGVGGGPGAAGAAGGQGAPGAPGSGQPCRDYLERGVCLRGKSCPFDHGAAKPIMIETPGFPPGGMYPMGVGVPGMRPPGGLGMYAPGLPGMRPPFMHAAMAAMLQQQQMQQQHQKQNGANGPGAPEAYNPEEPTMTGLGRHDRNDERAHLQNDGMYDRDRRFDGDRNNDDGDGFRRGGRGGSRGGRGGRGGGDRGRGDDREGGGRGGMSSRGFGARHEPYDRSKQGRRSDTTLEIKNIPPELNNIGALLEYFKRFGDIANIQVGLGSFRKDAVIQYARPADARSAHECPDAVLGNRFIKVFWSHEAPVETEEVKAVEAAAAAAAAAAGNSGNSGTEAAAGADGVAAGGAAAPAVAKAATTPGKNTVLKSIIEMQKMQEQLIQRQIGEQKALVEKMTSGTVSAKMREEIMKRMELLSNSLAQAKKQQAMATAAAAAQHSQQQSLQQSHAQSQAAHAQNAPAPHLANKLAELKQEAASLGLLDRPLSAGPKPYAPRGRGAFGAPRGRGAAAGARGRGGRPGNSVLDLRTTKVLVSGYLSDDKDDLVTHLSAIAEVDGVTHGEKASIVTFKTRKGAETAIAHGTRFKGSLLNMSWYNATPKPTTAAPNTTNGTSAHSTDKVETEAEAQGAPAAAEADADANADAAPKDSKDADLGDDGLLDDYDDDLLKYDDHVDTGADFDDDDLGLSA